MYNQIIYLYRGLKIYVSMAIIGLKSEFLQVLTIKSYKAGLRKKSIFCKVDDWSEIFDLAKINDEQITHLDQGL